MCEELRCEQPWMKNLSEKILILHMWQHTHMNDILLTVLFAGTGRESVRGENQVLRDWNLPTALGLEQPSRR